VNILKLLIPFLLFGCAPTTVELIEEAHRTADWSLGNKRFEAEEKRKAERAPSCPLGTARWRDRRFGDEGLSCVRDSDLREIRDSMGL